MTAESKSKKMTRMTIAEAIELLNKKALTDLPGLLMEAYQLGYEEGLNDAQVITLQRTTHIYQ
jgi:hypothetical protein